MADTVPPPTSGVYCSTTCSYDIHIRDKMNMRPEIFPPNDVSFPTNTINQNNPSYLSAVPTLQVRQAVTHIYSNGTRVPKITTKVVIFSISGDPMYLNTGTANQCHQVKIDSLREPSYPKFFHQQHYLASPYQHTPKNTATTIGFGYHCHTPETTNFAPHPL